MAENAAEVGDRAAQRLAEIAAQFGQWRISVADRTVHWSVGVASIFGTPMQDRGSLPLEQHLAFCLLTIATRFALASKP